jgi:hypothetical protein
MIKFFEKLDKWRSLPRLWLQNDGWLQILTSQLNRCKNFFGPKMKIKQLYIHITNSFTLYQLVHDKKKLCKKEEKSK